VNADEVTRAKRSVIIGDILLERRRQEQLKAEGRFSATAADMVDAEALAVLVEEVGEVARAVLEKQRLANDKHGKDLRKELVQTAAVCVAWLEGLDRDGRRPPPVPDPRQDPGQEIREFGRRP